MTTEATAGTVKKPESGPAGGAESRPGGETDTTRTTAEQTREAAEEEASCAPEAREARAGEPGGRDGERVEWLDRLRGLALLATVPVAMRWWMHPRDTMAHPWLADPVDGLAWGWWILTDGLFQGTPVLVLGMICGYALVLRDRQGRREGMSLRRRRVRQGVRAVILAVVGCLVASLLWAGELLTMTAVVLLVSGEPARGRTSITPAIWLTAAGVGAALPALTEVMLWAMTPVVERDAWTWAATSPGFLAWEEAKMLASWRDAQEVRLSQWATEWGQGPGMFAALKPIGTLATVWAAVQAGVWFGRSEPAWNAWRDPALGFTGTLLTFGACALLAGTGFEGPAVPIAQTMSRSGAFLLALFALTVALHQHAGDWFADPRLAPAGRIGRIPVSFHLATVTTAIAMSHSWGGQLHSSLPHEGMLALTVLMWAAWWFGGPRTEPIRDWLPEELVIRRGQRVVDDTVEKIAKEVSKVLKG